MVQTPREARRADGSRNCLCALGRLGEECPAEYIARQQLRDQGCPPSRWAGRPDCSRACSEGTGEAAAVGLGANFNGQSPRVGMAQDSIATGAELHRLMSVGNWKTSAMPMQYARNQAKLGAVARYYTK